MLLGADIAEAVHTKACDLEAHDFMVHIHTSSYYAEYLNERNIDVTADKFADTVLAIAWPDRSVPWPNHPHPDTVIEYLKEHEND